MNMLIVLFFPKLPLNCQQSTSICDKAFFRTNLHWLQLHLVFQSRTDTSLMFGKVTSLVAQIYLVPIFSPFLLEVFLRHKHVKSRTTSFQNSKLSLKFVSTQTSCALPSRGMFIPRVTSLV